MGERTLCVCRAADCRGHRAAQLAHSVDGQLVLASANWSVRLDDAPLMVLTPLADTRVSATAVDATLGDRALVV